MALVPAGKLDRRLLLQATPEIKDAAGDVVRLPWTDQFKLWARLKSRGPGNEQPAEGGVLRQFDTIFQVRDSPKSRLIAPETWRVLWKGRVYEIVSLAPDDVRADLLNVLCAARPDLRGSRGIEGESGEP